MSMVKRIFSIMEEKELSAYQVEKETGVKQSNLSRWKAGKGKPGRDSLEKLAAYFGVSVDYLINGDPGDPVGIVGEDDGFVSFADLTEDERIAVRAFLKAYREEKHR